MELLKNQIQLTLTKSELQALIAEALADPDSSMAIKRVLNPLLEGKFPQFPTFTNITLGDTAEDGATTVILKEPRQATPKSDSPIKSMEPLEVVEPSITEEQPESPAYVE